VDAILLLRGVRQAIDADRASKIAVDNPADLDYLSLIELYMT
jgi:hypothetical protein